jgi:hypothetical protein
VLTHEELKQDIAHQAHQFALLCDEIGIAKTQQEREVKEAQLKGVVDMINKRVSEYFAARSSPKSV